MAGHSIHAEDANDRGEEDGKGETTPAVLLLGIHLVGASINNIRSFDLCMRKGVAIGIQNHNHK